MFNLRVTLILCLFVWMSGIQANTVVHVCENNIETISCSQPRTSIEITSAAYGRTSVDFCPHNTYPYSNTICIPDGSADHLGIVKNICDGKTSCELEAKNSVFGDTCSGTYKYLEVTYECKSDSLFICENNTETISCSESGTTLEVTYAAYGRTSTETCTDTTYPTSDTTCTPGGNTDHLGTVKNICDGETSCELEAASSVFGDTCPGTYKYLEVDFKCSRNSTIICEHFHETITCPLPGMVLSMTSAAYGRTSTDVCTNTTKPHSKTDCIPSNDTDHLGIVKEICDGKEFCELEAENSVFADTCLGTYKYLEITYDCLDLNLALNKVTNQTGLKKGKEKFRSIKAVDGNIKTCAKTSKIQHPKWWVDLGGTAVVRKVKLTNLGPGTRRRGVKVTVYVGQNDNDLSQPCDSYVGPRVNSYTFVCPPDTQGRFVIVQRNTTYMTRKGPKERTRRLRICEAEVFGYFL